MKLILDSEEISQLCRNAEGFSFDPKAEEDLDKILQIQETINKFVETVKQNIAQNALQEDANFTAIKGNKIKAEYRAYGAVYKATDMSKVRETFKITKITETLNSKAVEIYCRENNGKTPEGIEVVDRQKKLTLKRVG